MWYVLQNVNFLRSWLKHKTDMKFQLLWQPYEHKGKILKKLKIVTHHVRIFVEFRNLGEIWKQGLVLDFKFWYCSSSGAIAHVNNDDVISFAHGNSTVTWYLPDGPCSCLYLKEKSKQGQSLFVLLFFLYFFGGGCFCCFFSVNCHILFIE